VIRPAAIVLGIAALAAAAGPAIAAAPTPGGVLVNRVTVDGAPAGQTLLTQQELVAAEDLDGRLVSAAALVGLARVPPDRLAELRVPYVGKPGAITVSRDEVVAGGATFDPEYNAQDVRFRRGDDEISPATSERLRVTLVTTGTVLAVTAAADHAQVDAGGAVHFTATAPDAPPGTTYAWAFGDDAYEEAGAATEADHVFAANGVYLATATARSPDGSAGVSAPVSIRVGTPAADAPTDGAPAGAAPPTAPPPAAVPPPVRETAGGGPGDRRAPVSGRDGETGTAVHARRGTHRTRAAPATTSAPPNGSTPTDPAAVPAPFPVDRAANDTAAASPPSPARRRDDPAAGAGTGTGPGTVRGLVLVGFHGEALAPPGSSPTETDRQDPSAARAASGGDAADGATWLALPGLLVLLALGATRELARRDRPLGPA